MIYNQPKKKLQLCWRHTFYACMTFLCTWWDQMCCSFVLCPTYHYFRIRNFGDIYNGAVYRVGLLSCACSQRKVFYTILPFIVTILCALFWWGELLSTIFYVVNKMGWFTMLSWSVPVGKTKGHRGPLNDWGCPNYVDWSSMIMIAVSLFSQTNCIVIKCRWHWFIWAA